MVQITPYRASSTPSPYFDFETPAPMTPGSCSSPTLKSSPMANDKTPSKMTVRLANSQKGTLMSTLWHAAPAQWSRVPLSRLVDKQWQAKQGGTSSDESSSSAYLSSQLP